MLCAVNSNIVEMHKNKYILYWKEHQQSFIMPMHCVTRDGLTWIHAFRNAPFIIRGVEKQKKEKVEADI